VVVEYGVEKVMSKIVAIAIMFASLSFITESGYCSGGGVLSVGPVATGMAGKADFREWIEFVPEGKLLVARPKHPLMKLITIYAPGIDRGHLLLRIEHHPDGRGSLLLTGPDSFIDKIGRTNLYFKKSTLGMTLFEQTDSGLQPQHSQLVFVEGNGENKPPIELRAFVVSGPGLYWFGDTGVSLNPIGGFEQIKSGTSSTLVQNRISRGMWNWIWPLIILAIGFSISCLAHFLQVRAGI